MELNIDGIWAKKAGDKNPVTNLTLSAQDDKCFFSISKDEKVEQDVFVDVLFNGIVISRQVFDLTSSSTVSFVVPRPFEEKKSHTIQIVITDWENSHVMYTSPVFTLKY